MLLAAASARGGQLPLPFRDANGLQARVVTTDAIVVARLTAKQPDGENPVVVFEKIRVVRGEEPRDRIVHRYPLTMRGRDSRDGGLSILADTLTEGNVYLLFERRRPSQDEAENAILPEILTGWTPLASSADRDAIQRALEPYARLDEFRQISPRDAAKIVIIQKYDPLALLYFLHRAPAGEVNEFFAACVEAANQGSPDSLFAASNVLSLGGSRFGKDLSSEMLADMVKYLLKLVRDPPSGVDPNRAGSLASYALRWIHEGASDRVEIDQVLIESLAAPNGDMRRGALVGLQKRKVPAAIPTLRQVVADGFPNLTPEQSGWSETTPTQFRQDAAKALEFQLQATEPNEPSEAGAGLATPKQE